MVDEEVAQVRRFIAKHVNGVEIADDEDLFAAGHVNSLFAVQLVMWIERTFDVPVDSQDLDIANFRAISTIVSFVDAKRTAGEPLAEASAARGGAWTSR